MLAVGRCCLGIRLQWKQACGWQQPHCCSTGTVGLWSAWWGSGCDKVDEASGSMQRIVNIFPNWRARPGFAPNGCWVTATTSIGKPGKLGRSDGSRYQKHRATAPRRPSFLHDPGRLRPPLHRCCCCVSALQLNLHPSRWFPAPPTLYHVALPPWASASSQDCRRARVICAATLQSCLCNATSPCRFLARRPNRAPRVA